MENSISLRDMSAKGVSNSADELVSRVVREIRLAVNDDPESRTNETMFFRLVTGGNVTVVREIIQCLHSQGLYRELSWATGRPLYGGTDDGLGTLLEDGNCSSRRCSDGIQFGKWLCFGLLSALIVVTSPVFYAVHAVLWEMGARRRAKWDGDGDIGIGLVYALLSEERDMVRLFLESGCPLAATDKDGNNVYHYLAEMSAEQCPKAIRCHEILRAACDDAPSLKYVVTEQRNRMQYTAWECAAKYGSLLFCCKLANDECGFGSPILCVSKELLWAKLPSGRDVSVEADSGNTPEGVFNVWQFDITAYETGGAYSRQSYPLRLIVSRAVETLREADINAVLTSDFIRKWMDWKISRYLFPCVVSHLIGVAITVLFLAHLIWHGGSMDLKPSSAGAWAKEIHAREPGGNSDWVFPSQNSTGRTFRTAANGSRRDTLGNRRPMDEMRRGCVDVLLELAEDADGDRESGIRLALNVIVGICVIQDLLCRLVFLANNYNWSADSWQSAALPVLFNRLPGSYTDRQLSSLMYFLYGAGALLGRLHLDAAKDEVGNRPSFLRQVARLPTNVTYGTPAAPAEAIFRAFERREFPSAMASKVLIVCLLLRFVQTIYALRLLPNVGFFIITAKKMANTLLQFAIVFIIVLLAFGTIFYFIMRQPKCPAEKMDGFKSLASSLFSAYQVSLGYGSHRFSVHLNARLAYVAFTVIAVVLLLNLVIAVMTTTVEHMSQMPWKVMLISFELWEEILGVEAVLLVLISPFKRLFKCKKTANSSKKTTFETVQWEKGAYFS